MKSRAVLIFISVTATVFAIAEKAPALAQARTLASAISDEDLREELQQEVAVTLARQGQTAAALDLSHTLSPFRQAVIILTVAAALPPEEKAQAEQLVLEAQTDRALTHDWHKSRLSRLLAVAHARLGHFDTAETMAKDNPDTEDRAFALAEVVAEISRAGEIAKARELAGTIEENRRYGTYRQKAGALSDVARVLFQRGDTEGAATLLEQAGLLLPKKPGWSDGSAMIDVALAAHACAEIEKASSLLERSEELAQAIGGAWKVRELARVSAAWRTCGQPKRADTLLQEARDFLPTLPPLERAPEAIALARAEANAGAVDAARLLLSALLADQGHAETSGPWLAIRVSATLAWSEITGTDLPR